VSEVEKKFVSLAKAIPPDKYEWRPGAGVRSVGEVIRHVAADNYLIPAGLGFAADASTGIKGDDYKTAVAFEAKKSTKDQSIADLEKSFAHLKQSMQATPAAKLSDQVKLFGQPFTMQRLDPGHHAPARASGSADRLCADEQREAAVEPIGRERRKAGSG
jgi:hypothetical protein